jgi:hypothetical protein
MEGRCEDCINCKQTWSAGADLSCHDVCEKFREWKEKGEGIVLVATQKSKG